jgi:hypothetical protein
MYEDDDAGDETETLRTGHPKFHQLFIGSYDNTTAPWMSAGTLPAGNAL